MRRHFTVIEGGGATPGGEAASGASIGQPGWRIDLRRAAAVAPDDIAAWRALLVRAAVADPVHADPDYLLSAAQHQAGGRDLVFALAWAVGGGPDRLHALVPLALPHTLWGSGRIGVWQPHGTALAPTILAGSAPAVREALAAHLRTLRPRAVLVLDAPADSVPAEPAPRARLRAVRIRGGIPARSLVGIRPPAGAEPPLVERIGEPHRIRDAVEAYLLLDAEVSAAPVIGDPSEAALVRVVTRLFAQRRQVTVALTRRAGTVVAATVILGTGAHAVVWRHAEGTVVPERIDRPA